MRIGYDASPLRRYPSGVGHYVASLLEGLLDKFPETQFLFLSHLTHSAFTHVNLTRTQKRSFPVKEIWMQVWLPRILARYRPTICHFTNGVSPLRMEVPYVMTVHDLSLIRHPEWHPRSRRAWMRRIMRPSALAASGILCNSEATRKDVLNWIEVDASRVWVVPLGARAVFRQVCSQARRDAVLAKYGLSKPFFLYVGNIEPRKNLSVLFEAFGRLARREVDLVLAGSRAWLWKDTLDDARRLLVAGKAHLLDYVPEADLGALYQSALAFVYPSRMEGFGLPVLEAMTSGLPVVASRVEPLVSLVGDAGWLVSPDVADEWSAALEQVWKDERRRLELAALARARAAPYTWEKAAQATMRCYQEALSRRAMHVGL